MSYLTDQDKAFFKENGFLVVRSALDSQIVAAAQDVFWSHVAEMDPDIQRDDPETWMDKGYQTVPCGGESEIKKLVYEDPIFTMAEEMVGQGLILWTPKGASVRTELQNFIAAELHKQGYQQVYIDRKTLLFV